MIHLLLLFASTFADEYPVAPAVDTGSLLRVESGWVREAPPNMEVMAAYAILCNDKATGVILAGASSKDFNAIEMHDTIEANGGVRMERLKSVAIGPQDCVSFAPGGRHFMLLDPMRPLRSGSEVKLTLQLADGREMEVVFPVRRADEMLDNSHDHSGHH